MHHFHSVIQPLWCLPMRTVLALLKAKAKMFGQTLKCAKLVNEFVTERLVMFYVVVMQETVHQSPVFDC